MESSLSSIRSQNNKSEEHIMYSSNSNTSKRNSKIVEVKKQSDRQSDNEEVRIKSQVFNSVLNLNLE